MKYPGLLKLFPLIFLLAPATLHAETDSAKNHSLEEMSPEEFRAALKKSHSEIEARLGSSGTEETTTESDSAAKGKTTSLSEKRAYETSAQSRIDLLGYKIQTLESRHKDNWGYSESDADKLRNIKSKAQDQLIKIKSDNTEGWKTNKQALDSLLREASYSYG